MYNRIIFIFTPNIRKNIVSPYETHQIIKQFEHVNGIKNVFKIFGKNLHIMILLNDGTIMVYGDNVCYYFEPIYDNEGNLMNNVKEICFNNSNTKILLNTGNFMKLNIDRLFQIADHIVEAQNSDDLNKFFNES